MKKFKSLASIPTGTYFKTKSTISGHHMSGLIYNCPAEGAIYLCQNTQDGSTSPDRLGHAYSWVVYYNESSILSKLSFPPMPKNYKDKHKVIYIKGDIVRFKKNHITVGCTDINHSLVIEIAGRILGRKLRR